MEDVLKKKINLLVHLAKADGHFHLAERKFLEELLTKHKVSGYELTRTLQKNPEFAETEGMVEKELLLYWAFQLIKADGEIHADEVAYCKALAIKLGFQSTIVDFYKDQDLPSLDNFISEVAKYLVKS